MSVIYSDFIAGCFGGACGTLVGHPLDCIKTWQQATNSRITTAVYDIIVRNNGLNGFYRGMSFPLFLGGALNSILFGVYGYEVRRLQSTCESESGKRKNRQIHTFIAGSMAGLIHSFVACPLELIKIRLQTQNCKSFCFLPQAASLYYVDKQSDARGPKQCIKKIYKTSGLLGFYRGMTPMICRDVFPYGIYMLTYDHMTNLTNILLYDKTNYSKSHIDIVTTVVAGTIAGLMSWVLVIPFDVVKTVIQSQPDLEQSSNMRTIMHRKVDRYGWRILFRGSWMLLFKSIPTNAATFLGFEYAHRKCQYFLAN